MNRKFKIDQYEICANFKTDNVLSMTAQFLPTNEYFANDSIELMRIKKDTVFATLERKSEKNLTCTFEQSIEDGKKYLIVSFIVNFDYLPQFREDIRLNYVEKKDKIIKLQTNSFQAEIEEINMVLDAFEKLGSSRVREVSTSLIGQEKTIWAENLPRGKYLLRLSSHYVNPTKGNAIDTITFNVLAPHQPNPITMIVTSFNLHAGYVHPISCSQILEMDKEGEATITAHSNGGNASLTNTHVIISPVTGIN